jgi:putative transcriptional regulator|tara:strand:+ start:94 stop:321 length:228 start_codon:yes stop_codon:yes gene_type:complete
MDQSFAIEKVGILSFIKSFKDYVNLTQKDLAKKVGVRRETIVFLEKGKYNPSLQLAHDVAKALKTTIEELFIFGK